MFDAVSFVREKILRRPKIISPLAGEEVTEKQTTKLGYFLLYCMFAAILASAQWTLSIIKNIPTAPTSVPSCIIQVIDTFGVKHDTYASHGYDYTDYYGTNDDYSCPLTASHPTFDFTTEYTALKKPYESILQYEESLRELESKKNSLEYTQDSTQKDYDTALTEKIAGENDQVYGTQQVKTNLRTSRAQIATLGSQMAQIESSIQSLKSQYQSQAMALKGKADIVDDSYKTAYLLYRLYIALLSFVFAIIVFAILYKFYVKQKIKNSPHTVIFSVATFAYGLIILQISCLFIWDIIPHKIFTLIMDFLSSFMPVLYLVQFLWPLFIVAIFGYLVFRIQKRLYSPQNVLKRFISDKKCPHCGNGVDISKPFCPLCAHEIQIRCEKCHEFTVKGMPYCAQCGAPISEPKK